MKNIKLPRKRKKLYLKSHSKIDYIAFQILGEVFYEEGIANYDRLYKYSEVTPTREYPNGLKPIKRW